MKVGQLRFKRHGRYNSIIYPQYGSFSIRENRLKLSFVNGLIKIKMHRIPVGIMKKSCTIIRDIDRWFVCKTMTTIKNTSIKNKNDSIIDVDVGLTNWITLSDGQVIDRPKFLSKSLKKIKTLQKVIKEKEGFPLHTVTTYLNMLQVAL